jgi:hypothetical protein
MKLRRPVFTHAYTHKQNVSPKVSNPTHSTRSAEIENVQVTYIASMHHNAPELIQQLQTIISN